MRDQTSSYRGCTVFGGGGLITTDAGRGVMAGITAGVAAGVTGRLALGVAGVTAIGLGVSGLTEAQPTSIISSAAGRRRALRCSKFWAVCFNAHL
jgi:hypothetical protein